jgi:hypothetical protein
MWSGVTAALLSLVPGLLAWWRGRSLIRLADQADLPERLADYRQLWAVDATSGTLGALGGVPGSSASVALGPDGRLAVHTERGGALFDTATRTAVRFTLPGDSEAPHGLALEAAGLGALVGRAGRATVTLYEIR